ncbi:hypothetical protein X759_27270 [Mesorhizobium sp. LSHC420B00]|nr:hypothetical protein X759_27270 [Mesorhizobium sp. LSHC420B00]
MRARHVIGNGHMAAPVGRTGVAGDPLTLVEYLNGLVGDAHIDELADGGAFVEPTDAMEEKLPAG